MTAILHLGYPKTGTTFLQRKLFPQLAQTHTVVTPEFENCRINIKLLKQEIQNGAVHSKMSPEACSRPILFSMEGLLFDAMRGESSGRYAPRNFASGLIGLKSLCPDVLEKDIAIVLYLRRQDELIHSLFAESKTFFFNHISSMRTLEAYVATVLACDSRPEDPGYYYHYSNTLQEIKKVFPESRIHVRFYERLSDALPTEILFWQQLTGFQFDGIEGRENGRRLDGNRKIADPKSLRVPVVRWKNKYLPTIKLPNKASRLAEDVLNRFRYGSPDIIELGDALRHSIRLHFADSNRQLNAVLDTLGTSLPECYLHFEDSI